MQTNINVHFEEAGMAVTDMTKFIINLYKAGYRKVAATNRGSFTQYEDLISEISHIKDTVKKYENMDKRPENDPNYDLYRSLKGFDFEVIPALQCYFEGPDESLILIAKNYEGYLSLCKIITQSNELGTIITDKDNRNNNKPIVYLDNLKENVTKGNLYLTTAGSEGVFCQRLSLQKSAIEQEIKELEKQLSCIYKSEQGDISYYVARDLTNYYNDLLQIKRPLKKELTLAEKYFKTTGDNSDIIAYNEKLALYEDAALKKQMMRPLAEELEKAMKSYKKIYTKLLKKEEELEHLDKDDTNLKSLYKELENIFGRENIFFELQNHNISSEKEAMNKLISFAKDVENEKFVVSNSINIGVTKDDPSLNDEFDRLEVATFLNNKDYIPLNRNELNQHIIMQEEDYEKSLNDLITNNNQEKPLITATAISNVDEMMSQCIIVNKGKPNHYPSFCENSDEEFEKKCMAGIPWRFPNGFPDKEKYEQRLQYELNIIKSMGYTSYHLIVQDYLEYGRLLGYLPDKGLDKAPLSIEGLKQYIKDNHIKEIGVGIGPGRGSAVGSLCCYLLGITDLDPIKYNLLFERFLNPERVSMPDIDSDFRPEVRLKAREYVRARYGEKNVCEIVTKSYHGEKGCIHDIARFIGAKLGYEKDKKEAETLKEKWTRIGNVLAKKTESYADFDKFLEKESASFTEEEKQIIEMIPKVLNIFTGFSQHAAGVIISKDEIQSEMPLMWNDTTTSMQTQCQMAAAEAKGYLKMDFLGLRNLAIITDTERIIENEAPEKRPISDEMNLACQDANLREKYILNDKNILDKVFCTGLTQGVFQFESKGMKQMLMKFQPESFDDIILLVAAYRPGPLDYIPEIIAQKWYRKDPDHYLEKISELFPLGQSDAQGHRKNENLYPVPKSSITLENDTLKEILKNTYNCPIYQEQIMQIFQHMGGYSLGRADEVRRAMSKKKQEKILKEKDIFINGNEKEIQEAKDTLRSLKESLDKAPENEKPVIEKKIENCKIPAYVPGIIKKHGVTKEEAEQLFEQMIPFAKYGFNKSHAAVYAVVAMETAYQKTYSPKEFYCSALNNWKNRDELEKYAQEMPYFGVNLLEPVITNTNDDFTVEDDGIRFPIAKAKNFSSINGIVPSTNITEFILRNPNISDTQIKSLNNLGVFDSCFYYSNLEAMDIERKRTDHNVLYMESFIKENYKLISKYGSYLQKVKEENPSFPKIQNNTKNYQVFKELRLELNEKVRIAKQEGIKHPDGQQILEIRNRQYDLTGYIFGLEKEIERLNECPLDTTFDTIKAEIGTVEIPCVLVSADYSAKLTKSGSTVYYNVTLMDKAGNKQIRRFDHVPTVLDGVFKLQCNPYFLNQARNVKALPKISQTKGIKEDIQEFLKKTDTSPFQIMADKNIIEEERDL